MVLGLLRPLILTRIIAGVGLFFLILKLIFPKAGFFGYYGVLFLITGLIGILVTTGLGAKLLKK